jgi:hypothetical protein
VVPPCIRHLYSVTYMHYTYIGLIDESGTSDATSMPCPSDATFHAIDWSPGDILIPYVLLAVFVQCLTSSFHQWADSGMFWLRTRSTTSRRISSMNRSSGWPPTTTRATMTTTMGTTRATMTTAMGTTRATMTATTAITTPVLLTFKRRALALPGNARGDSDACAANKVDPVSTAIST